MASESAELTYSRRRADAQSQRAARKGGSRPAYRPYEPIGDAPLRSIPQRNEEDFHPEAKLKTFTVSELRAICIVVVVIAAIGLGIILLSAQATVKQKEINDLKSSIAQVDDDIANLRIEIEQARNMEKIKSLALTDLGMREPSFDQYVYVSDLPEVQSGFGQYIKEKAYGGTQTQTEESGTEPGQ